MRKWLLLGILASVGLLGCSKETDSYYIQINSDTQWVAHYGPVGAPDAEKEIAGEGNKRVDILHVPPVCLRGQKLTADGFLEVVAYKHVSKKGGLFHSDNEQDVEQDSQRTTDAAGVVEACTK